MAALAFVGALLAVGLTTWGAIGRSTNDSPVLNLSVMPPAGMSTVRVPSTVIPSSVRRSVSASTWLTAVTLPWLSVKSLGSAEAKS